jgi:inhibitor of KinA sporulation pathway (predicted exonuclease)
MADRHLMVDIETFDTEVTATILAIGAVVFDPRKIDPNGNDFFHTTISTKSQHNRTVSESTQEWWRNQSKEAQDSVFGGEQLPIGLALANFAQWLNKMRPTCTRVWAKSPDFDCSILRHACVQNGVIWPFKFWEARCCRTIMELAYPEGDFPHIEMKGPKHDALADARKQASEVQHAYHVLGC